MADRDELFLAQAAMFVARDLGATTTRHFRDLLEKHIQITESEFKKTAELFKKHLTLDNDDCMKLTKDQMLRILRDPAAHAVTISIVAERFGGRFTAEEVAPDLIHLLKHPRPMTREGALLGLRSHPEDGRVREAVEHTAKTDTCPEVCAAAEDILTEWSER